MMVEKLEHTNRDIAAEIHSVFQASYAIEAGLLGVTDFPPLCRTVTDIQNSKTLFFGYYKSESIAAALELMTDDGTTEICSLVVRPEFFRQGLASCLLSFAEVFGGPEWVSVETGLLNEPAIKLYRNFGFIEQRRWLTSAGINKIRFRKIVS